MTEAMLHALDITNFRSIRGSVHAPLDAKVVLGRVPVLDEPAEQAVGGRGTARAEDAGVDCAHDRMVHHDPPPREESAEGKRGGRETCVIRCRAHGIQGCSNLA